MSACSHEERIGTLQQICPYMMKPVANQNSEVFMHRGDDSHPFISRMEMQAYYSRM